MAESDLPSHIGPYAILGVLGEGGMGVVYLAEQSEPVRRAVALKVLRAERSSAVVVARFEAERQVLAVMDHPAIAKVFDAGVTEDGQSYFAMERVEGLPITTFCDERRMPVRARVELFREVCRAVQHAHQKGVIHRDLKPSNVLVSVVDGRPAPHIIDFGIAKAVENEALDGTQLTQANHVVGTPAYMSPEQIDGSQDVDTRADVYSLGVLLYELLVGVLPFGEEAYRGWAAVVALLHRDPPPPTRRLSELPETQETVAFARGTTPVALRRQLAGDLDWIVTRATERDRAARYETANGLALDLERYLADEPVRARGAGAAYVLRKFVRRNRLAVAFGATVMVGLAAFAVSATVQSQRTSRARDLAEARRGQAEELIDFMLTDLRGKLEPLGRLDVLNDIGEQALSYFASLPEDQFSDEELASRSQSLYQIGSVRLDEGRSAEAVAAFAESLRLARELSARAPEDTVRLFGLSQSHFYVGYASYLNGDLESAETQFEAYLAVAEKLTSLAPDNLDYRMEVGYAHSNLGSVREARGDLAGAGEAYRGNLVVEEELLRREPSRLDWLGENAETHNKLAVVYARQGRYREALEEHRRELAVKEHVLSLDPEHAYWRYRRGFTHHFLGKLEESLGDLATAAREQGTAVAALDSLVRRDPANARWRRARAVMERSHGRVLSKQGRHGAALAMLRRSADALGTLAAADTSSLELRADYGGARAELADALLRSGQPAAAAREAEAGLDLLLDAPAGLRQAQGDRVYALLALGRARAADGDGGGAEKAWRDALTEAGQLRAEPGGEEFAPLLAEAHLVLGQVPEARAVLAELEERGYGEPELWRLAAERGVN